MALSLRTLKDGFSQIYSNFKIITYAINVRDLQSYYSYSHLLLLTGQGLTVKAPKCYILNVILTFYLVSILHVIVSFPENAEILISSFTVIKDYIHNVFKYYLYF